MFSTGTRFEKPKIIQKSVRFLLSTGTISRKRAQNNPKKNRQNEFSTRYTFQNSFLFVDSVAGTKYGDSGTYIWTLGSFRQKRFT